MGERKSSDSSERMLNGKPLVFQPDGSSDFTVKSDEPLCFEICASWIRLIGPNPRYPILDFLYHAGIGLVALLMLAEFR
jgi:hypothetical protein